MLTEVQINSNKKEFLELIESISREGSNIELLEKQLVNSDFFIAPASGSEKYHECYEGGLCLHSINVYKNLHKLNDTFNLGFSEDSMKIVGLLHDFAKMNFYTSEYKNKKVYCETGSKRDEGGRFDWVAVKGYTVKEAENRFILGNHEQNSAFMANTFIPLTVEEYSAILHHHNGMGWDSAKDDLATIYKVYPLAMYLFMADMIDTYNKEE